MGRRLRNLTFIAFCAIVSCAKSPPAQTYDFSKDKAAVQALLKDPASAQFRNLTRRVYNDHVWTCGEVNAKNSYGGYIGFRKFQVEFDGTAHMQIDDTSTLDRIDQNAMSENMAVQIACEKIQADIRQRE